jgi:hypothetical protein
MSAVSLCIRSFSHALRPLRGQSSHISGSIAGILSSRFIKRAFVARDWVFLLHSFRSIPACFTLLPTREGES